MNKLEQIQEMWEKDGEIDVTNVSGESANIPKLHNKYYQLYVKEGLRLKKLRADYKQFSKLKHQYYRGELDDEELRENGWSPQPLKLLRQDVPQYVEADQEIIDMTLRIGMQEAIVDYLESIIQQINKRGYQLKTIVDWERFKTGAI